MRIKYAKVASKPTIFWSSKKRNEEFKGYEITEEKEKKKQKGIEERKERVANPGVVDSPT